MPVWVAASAKAATEVLLGQPFNAEQRLIVPNQEKQLVVPVASASFIDGTNKALAISFCDSGISLDITRNMEVWVCVHLREKLDTASDQCLFIKAGFGTGKYLSSGELCISNFAREVLQLNIRTLLPKEYSLDIEIIFPKGKELSLRTSNSAFGVIDGLALIGTQAEAQISSSPDQVQRSIKELRSKCDSKSFKEPLTLVIGENGLNLALNLGIESQSLLKVGNWLGPLILAAAESNVKKLLIFGYHGKLIKLAGGIFHLHHHLADARLEILVSLAVSENLPLNLIKLLSMADSVDQAFLTLQERDVALARKLWLRIAQDVEKRSLLYLANYGSWPIEIGAALFDRSRHLRWAGSVGLKHLAFFDVSLTTKE